MTNLETELLIAIRTWAEIDNMAKSEVIATLRRIADRTRGGRARATMGARGEGDG